jgi:hypothetical protein
VLVGLMLWETLLFNLNTVRKRLAYSSTSINTAQGAPGLHHVQQHAEWQDLLVGS